MTESMRLQLQAAISVARADVAACGFALPRARILRPGLTPIDLTAHSARPAGMSAEAADDWFLQQLLEGGERIGEHLASYWRSSLLAPCERGTVLVTFMGELPTALRREGVALGCHIEAWDAGASRGIALAVLPYRVTDDVAQLGEVIPQTTQPLTATAN